MTITVAETIAIADIIINAALIVGLACYIQKTQINTRTLKDYFIKEIEKLHDDVIKYFEILEAGNLLPAEVENQFFRLINRASHLRILIESKYKGLSAFSLVDQLIQLQSVIDNDQNYTSNYRANTNFNLTPATVTEILDFRSNKAITFHEKIIEVNDYNKFLI